MESREQVNWRFGFATAAVAVAGVVFAIWRNAAEDRRVRVASYAGVDTEPSRVIVIGALVVTAVAVIALVVWWRAVLTKLDGPRTQVRGGAGVSSELERLVAMRDSGALSEDEFTAAKSRLLQQDPAQS